MITKAHNLKYGGSSNMKIVNTEFDSVMTVCWSVESADYTQNEGIGIPSVFDTTFSDCFHVDGL